MLEQQENPAQNQKDAELMTQLEGIRQKVFMDRYSLKDPSGNSLEFYPEHLWARVARGIAAIESTDEKRAEWEQKFFEALKDFQFVPGGRILAGAGSGHQVTYYNCMPPDQEVLTADGYRPISEIKIGDLVVTHRNRLRSVLHKFERETAETLYIIRPQKIGNGDLRLTGDHKVYIMRSEWFNKQESSNGLRLQHEPDWIPAKEIKSGDYVGAQISERDLVSKDYIEHDGLKWVQIDEIVEEAYSGVVLDIEVEEDHSFISAGVVVSNCFVIPSPEDSRQGILDNLKVMTEIMARGGGVGINLSTLRPRGSYIKTVNGTASGPCSWAQLYSVATGDVIQQGGCFGPDERIATNKGLIPTAELANRLDSGEALQAQTHKGLHPFTAVFRNGIKDLYEVTTSRGYRVRVTLDHKMGVLRDGEIVTIPLRELAEGDEILLLLGEGSQIDLPLVPLVASPYNRSKMSTTLNENVKLPTHLTPELAYFLGFLYGDGYVMTGKKVTWADNKGISLSLANTEIEARDRLVALIRDLFGLEPVVAAGDGACTIIRVYSRMLIDWLEENNLLKQKAGAIRLPEAIFRSPSTVMGAFIGGYFEADGCDRGKKGGYGIDSISHEMLQDIQQLLIANGIVSHISVQNRDAQGWSPIYRLIVTGAQFKERFSQFVTSYKDKQQAGLRSHFTDGTKDRVSQYALTKVRERVVAAGGAAMVERLDALLGVLPDAIISINPLGSSEVYDFEVEDVHLLAGGGLYTSNSRRGALMIMLDDTHPDIEEFITVKRTRGKIEHANLSICISDSFMAAVKDDTDWNLTWQGEVKKTIRARQLWDLICTSAWESAEPGMVFMDRYNKESNTWYYENIRCVNPCVTGDTLIYTDRGLLPAKELAELGTPITVVSPEVSIKELALAGHAKSGSSVAMTAPERTLRQASHVFSTGIKPVYRLQTTEGYTVRLTKDHRVLTEQGWKEAGDLVQGDKVILLNSEGAFGNTGSADLGKSIADSILHESKLQVPPSVQRGSREMQQGFLSALFTADGSVQGDLEVRLTSVSQELLEGVQRLLLNFGIASCLSQGGSASRELVISHSNLPTFAQQIGFLTSEKQSKLEDLLASYVRKPYQKKFVATFENLIPAGEEMVYDLSEPEMHLFVGNGLILHNCGEQGLPPFGVCNLGAINLSAFVKGGKLNWERLAEVSRISMRFLDDVIDSTEYFIEENQKAQLGTRRTGLGTMGLADALIKMKIAYGSDESLPIIERIYTTIRDAAYDASADIAAEKGIFPFFERDKYMQGKFIKRLPKNIQEKIKKQGIRNAVLLTQAPTGTTSLLAGVSSGIEPVYDFAMIRRDRTGEHIMYHPLLEAWRDRHPNESTPSYFVSSKDLTPEEHVRVQAMVQRYTDSSISKTVNAPNDHTVEQVQTLYSLAYEMGCKGVTYYRDGSRDAVLTRVEDEKVAAEKAAAAQQSAMMEPVTSIQQGIKARPAVVQGYTRQVKAPEGKINITINSDEQGPLEVFVNVGKAGSDIAALSEALGRLISLNLQILSPLSQTDRARVIAEQLRGIGGSRSVGFGVQQVRSLPDGVARALELHMESITPAKDEDDNGNGHTGEEKSLETLSPLQLSQLTVTGNMCPECGCNTMVYEEGCRKCYSCGHSEC